MIWWMKDLSLSVSLSSKKNSKSFKRNVSFVKATQNKETNVRLGHTKNKNCCPKSYKDSLKPNSNYAKKNLI